MTITRLTRDDWSAGPLGSGHVVPTSQFVGLVVHHTVIVMPDYDHDGLTAGDLDDARAYMQQLQRARPDLGPEVPYSFVVFAGATDLDAIVADGRGLGVTGAHTIGYNSTRYGIAYAGDMTSVAPTAGMLAGVRYCGRLLDNPAGAQPTLGHRDVYATACPGDAAYPHLPELQPPFTDPENDDMPRSFITQFLDWPGKLWLVDVEPRTTNGPLESSCGTRRYIANDQVLHALLVARVPQLPDPIPGGTLYLELK